MPGVPALRSPRRRCRSRRSSWSSRSTRRPPRHGGRAAAQRLRYLSLRAGHPKTHRPGDTIVKPTEPSSKRDSEVQRQHAEQEFAAELAALAAADDRAAPAELEALALGGAHLPPGRQAGRRLRDHAQVHRQRAADRDRGRDAGDRPRAAAAGRARARPRPGSRSTWRRRSPATRRCSSRAPPAPTRTPLRYGWNYARLLAEGPSARRAGAQPADARDGGRQDRARRGADPHPQRGAGHADHASSRRRRCRSPSSGPRCRRGAASTSSPPPTTATRASTSCRARSCAASTPSSCRCPTRSTKRSRSSRSACREHGPRAGAARRGARAGGDPPPRHDLPRAAQRRHRGRQDQAQVAERHAVDRRGDLGRQQRPGARRATSATACCAPPTSRPA